MGNPADAASCDTDHRQRNRPCRLQGCRPPTDRQPCSITRSECSPAPCCGARLLPFRIIQHEFLRRTTQHLAQPPQRPTLDRRRASDPQPRLCFDVSMAHLASKVLPTCRRRVASRPRTLSSDVVLLPTPPLPPRLELQAIECRIPQSSR